MVAWDPRAFRHTSAIPSRGCVDPASPEESAGNAVTPNAGGLLLGPQRGHLDLEMRRPVGAEIAYSHSQGFRFAPPLATFCRPVGAQF